MLHQGDHATLAPQHIQTVVLQEQVPGPSVIQSDVKSFNEEILWNLLFLTLSGPGSNFTAHPMVGSVR